MENQMIIVGSIIISISLIGLSYALVAIKIINRARKSAPPEEIYERHESGVLISHGMVRKSKAGARGLEKDKKLSDYYYDSLAK